MKLVKIEKPNCPACNQVGAFLDNQEVSYEKWDIMGDGENSDMARKTLQKLGLFTVPVTAAVSEENNVITYVRGFNPDELAALVRQFQ